MSQFPDLAAQDRRAKQAPIVFTTEQLQAAARTDVEINVRPSMAGGFSIVGGSLRGQARTAGMANDIASRYADECRESGLDVSLNLAEEGPVG